MSFPYTLNIPNPPSNPSTDVPNMQTNANSISSLIAVDHTGFNTSSGGTHLQVTFNGNNVPSSQPPPLQSVLYTNSGTADPAHPQLFWANFNSWNGSPTPLLTTPYPVSMCRAWATVDTTGALTNGFNITSVTHTIGSGSYTLNFQTNAVTGGGYTVVATPELSSGAPAICSLGSPTSASFTVFTYAFTPGVVQRDTTFFVAVFQT